MTEASKKKKWQPVHLTERQPVLFTDRQWQAVARYVGLPEKARPVIGEYAGFYRVFKHNSSGRPKTWETSQELKTMHETAERLLLLYNEMSGDAAGALMDTTGAMHKMHALECMKNVAEQIQRITDWIDKAKGHVKTNRKKPGQDSGDVDYLVRQLDVILHRFTGADIDQGKHALKYVIAVFAVTDPKVTLGTIEASIKRRIEQRQQQPESAPRTRPPVMAQWSI